MYTKKFCIQFGKYLRSVKEDPCDAFEKFEVLYQEPHLNFPYDDLVKIVCNHYKVNVEEFQSSFKYGMLPTVRKVVCYILDYFGMKNKHIAYLTGFTPSYISSALGLIRQDIDIKTEDINSILQQIKKVNDEKGNHYNHFCIGC